MSFETWEVLAVLGVVFAVLEVVTFTFYFLPVAMAFFMTSLVAHNTDSILYMSTSFLLTLGISFFAFHKVSQRLKKKVDVPTNYEGLVGKEVEVIADIEQRKPGTVKLYGDTWTALGKDGQEFKTGDFVVITDVVGNKVTVQAIN